MTELVVKLGGLEIRQDQPSGQDAGAPGEARLPGIHPFPDDDDQVVVAGRRGKPARHTDGPAGRALTSIG